MRCAVFGCKSDTRNKHEKVMFFRFPKEKKLIAQYLIKCRRTKELNVKNARICSKHFCEEDYADSLKFQLAKELLPHRRKLLKNAVPTLNLPSSSSRTKVDKAREERLKRRNYVKNIEEVWITEKRPQDIGEDADEGMRLKSDIDIKEELNDEVENSFKNVGEEGISGDADGGMCIKSEIGIKEEYELNDEAENSFKNVSQQDISEDADGGMCLKSEIYIKEEFELNDEMEEN